MRGQAAEDEDGFAFEERAKGNGGVAVGGDEDREGHGRQFFRMAWRRATTISMATRFWPPPGRMTSA